MFFWRDRSRAPTYVARSLPRSLKQRRSSRSQPSTCVKRGVEEGACAGEKRRKVGQDTRLRKPLAKPLARKRHFLSLALQQVEYFIDYTDSVVEFRTAHRPGTRSWQRQDLATPLHPMDASLSMTHVAIPVHGLL